MATKRKHLEARELNIEIKIQKYFENINIDITLNDETTASRSDFVKVIESNSQKLLCNDDSNADNDCKPPMDNAPEVLSCEPNSQQFLCNDVSSTDNYCKPPMDHAPEVLSCEKINELMKSALSSTVMVDALETIPALKKKCARFGIKGNFGYRQESHKPDRCGVYHVEQILDYDTTDYLYLVKWTGYGNEFNTWEPIDHLGCVTDMASDIRLMDKSLSGANKDAYKKMILLNSLLQEIASPDNKDAYILLKMTGISGLQYKPGNLAYLKNVLKSKSQRMRKALMADEQFRLDYCSILERTIKDLRIITSFESVEKLGEAVSRRNKFMKCLKNHEANINRIILKEEKGCATIELENYCDFDLPAEDFTYITKCKAGSPDIIISQSPRWSCKCGKYCQSITRKCCPIMNKSHRNYNNDGSLRSLKHNTIFECNSKCDCPSTCPNRVIQQGRKVSVTFNFHLVRIYNEIPYSLSLASLKRSTVAVGAFGHFNAFRKVDSLWNTLAK